jgi:hypothetical protein
MEEVGRAFARLLTSGDDAARYGAPDSGASARRGHQSYFGVVAGGGVAGVAAGAVGVEAGFVS